MKEALAQHIRQYTNPSPEELERFLDAFTKQEVKRKELILQQGQQCKYLYFIVQGCFRSFYINGKGIEKILHFGIDNWWLTDYDSLLNDKSSELNIQALEDSKVLRISQQSLNEFLDHSLELNKYFRMIQEKVRVADQRRIHYLFNLSGEEIYDIFREKNAPFLQRVPQYMLASFLGFTPEFLSKIRAKKK